MTTTETPMPSRDAQYSGTAPSTLRVEYRANGDVRFRVLTLGGPEAVVDIPDARVDDLVDDLYRRGKPREDR
jgi:hypothetical protein